MLRLDMCKRKESSCFSSLSSRVKYASKPNITDRRWASTMIGQWVGRSSVIASHLCLSSAGIATQVNLSSDCQGTWTAWGPCNVTCGQGFTSRTYSITMPALQGGQACPTAHGGVEESPCTASANPGVDPSDCTKCSPGYAGPAGTICPVGDWSAGGTASATTCTACGDGSTTISTGTNSSAGCSKLPGRLPRCFVQHPCKQSCTYQTA